MRTMEEFVSGPLRARSILLDRSGTYSTRQSLAPDGCTDNPPGFLKSISIGLGNHVRRGVTAPHAIAVGFCYPYTLLGTSVSSTILQIRGSEPIWTCPFQILPSVAIGRYGIWTHTERPVRRCRPVTRTGLVYHDALSSRP